MGAKKNPFRQMGEFLGESLGVKAAVENINQFAEKNDDELPAEKQRQARDAEKEDRKEADTTATAAAAAKAAADARTDARRRRLLGRRGFDATLLAGRQTTGV